MAGDPTQNPLVPIRCSLEYSFSFSYSHRHHGGKIRLAGCSSRPKGISALGKFMLELVRPNNNNGILLVKGLNTNFYPPGGRLSTRIKSTMHLHLPAEHWTEVFI